MAIAKNLQEALQTDFDLSFTDWVTKQQLIAALTRRIEELIAGNPDRLFSMLYRLDISEKKLKTAMASESNIARKIADMIYERQSEKVSSRKENKSNKPDDDLAW